ncbi:MAG: hypothetical protein JWM61_374 [Micrococcaceae bacterium]|jgi:hypothetical protein|nr:hypothetical protein [Micrococcaceae bacterium]
MPVARPLGAILAAIALALPATLVAALPASAAPAHDNTLLGTPQAAAHAHNDYEQDRRCTTRSRTVSRASRPTSGSSTASSWWPMISRM